MTPEHMNECAISKMGTNREEGVVVGVGYGVSGHGPIGHLSSKRRTEQCSECWYLPLPEGCLWAARAQMGRWGGRGCTDLASRWGG